MRIACDHGVFGKARIKRRVIDGKGAVLGDGVVAEGIGTRRLVGVEPATGLDPLRVGIDQGDGTAQVFMRKRLRPSPVD